jgi:anti-sigma B factor antagonist
MAVRGPTEVDISNSGRLQDDLISAIGLRSALVIADLARTTFCDCAGVTALLTAGRYAHEQGTELSVVACSAPVLRTFDLTGLPRQLAVYPTIEAAISREPTAPRSSRPGPVTSLSARRGTRAPESVPRPDQPRSL